MLYGFVIIAMTGAILAVYSDYLKLERRYAKLLGAAGKAELEYDANLKTLSREIDRIKVDHEKARAELVELINKAREDAAAWQTESLRLKAANDEYEAAVTELKLSNMAFEKNNRTTYEHTTTVIQLLWELVEQTGITPPQQEPAGDLDDLDSEQPTC